ncbi:MAG: hypothetical protein JW840_09160 [Candidatus Thermoplasmatota archaeon]|nr:hypothetical protein [Candidatus Thermoplasmatota archaeon]
MERKTPLRGIKSDLFGPEVKDNMKANQKDINTDSAEIDSLPDYDIELDMDNIVVLPIDGVVVENNDDEVKLLFYYYKPDRDNGEDDIIRCKCIAEFRVSPSHFITIAKDIINKTSDINVNQKKFNTGIEDVMYL